MMACTAPYRLFRLFVIQVCIFLVGVAGVAAQDPPANATELFDLHCASCHTGETSAPSLAHLASMSARSIRASLVSGRMAQYAEALDDAGKEAIAELLAGHELEDAELPAAARCDAALRCTHSIGGGMLLVNSGYGAFGQMPGNVILAFRVGR